MQNRRAYPPGFQLENPQIRANAREKLQGRWLKAAATTGGVVLVYQLLYSGLSWLMINILLWPLNIYMSVANGVFYLNRRREDVDAEAAKEPPTAQAE